MQNGPVFRVDFFVEYRCRLAEQYGISGGNHTGYMAGTILYKERVVT